MKMISTPSVSAIEFDASSEYEEKGEVRWDTQSCHLAAWYD